MSDANTPNEQASMPPSQEAWDRVERYLGEDALEQLARKKVAVVGLGSGGGFAALTLAMSGVGHFVLIDDDVVELTNVVRHAAAIDLSGLPRAVYWLQLQQESRLATYRVVVQ